MLYTSYVEESLKVESYTDITKSFLPVFTTVLKECNLIKERLYSEQIDISFWEKSFFLFIAFTVFGEGNSWSDVCLISFDPLLESCQTWYSGCP